MEAKIKALEIELSEERQMRQDKEQEVGQLSNVLYQSYKMLLQPWANKDDRTCRNDPTIIHSYADDSIEPY